MTDKETSSAKSVSISGRKREGTTEKTEFAVVTGRETCVRAFFKGKSELSVLDIGCNDGARTFHRFSDDRISRVIGLEYNQQLVERANSQFGNTKFSFLSDGCGSGFVFSGPSEALRRTGRQRI